MTVRGSETAGFEARSLSVLLIDDDPYALGLERRILEHLGIRDIVTAGDGEEALAVLGTGLVHFDVILSDLRMPGIDGIELLKRAREGWPETPYLLLTADRSEASVLSAQDLGVDAYVAKPFSPSHLLKSLKTIFERRDPTGLSAWQRSEEFRSLHVDGDPALRRLHELWDERRRGRSMPVAEDFLPIETSPVTVLRQHLMLAECVERGRFRCVVAGAELQRATGLALEGRFLDEQPAWFRRHTEAGFRTVLSSRRPNFQIVKTIESFAILRLQRLLLPLADASGTVGHVLGAAIRF